MLSRRLRPVLAIFSACLAFALSTGACALGSSSTTTGTNPILKGSGSPASGTPSATGTAATGDNPAPTVPAGVTSCSGVAGFGTAGNANAGAGYGDVPFPGSSISYVSSTSNNTYAYRLLSVCTPGQSPNDVRSFYSSQMPGSGWSQSSTFPYQGDPTRSCGDPYCWRSASNGIRYVSLESLSSSGSLTVYTIRLATAPSPSINLVSHDALVSVPNGSAQTVSVSCASGEQMVGGGFTIADTNQLYTAQQSYPSGPSTWTATVKNNTSEPMVLHAVVMCVFANYSFGIQIVHQALDLASGGEQLIAANCPANSWALTGGFQTSPGDNGWIQDSYPSGNMQSWIVAAQAKFGAMTETAYAVCATRNIGSSQTVYKYYNLPASSGLQPTADCSSHPGTLLTSGGFGVGNVAGAGDLFFSRADSRVYGDGSVSFAGVIYNRDSTAAHDASIEAICVTPNPVF